MNRKTNLILGGLSVAFGIYVIIRAWNIPVTLDECTTAIIHVPRSAMVPLLTLMLINMVQNANLRKSNEWWHDEYTYLIFDYLKKSQESEGRTEPFSLDCHWLLQNSFIYHLERDPRGFNLAAKLAPWHDVRPATREYEFYYALNQEDANPILDAYEVVLRVPKNSMMLLRKKKQ